MHPEYTLHMVPRPVPAPRGALWAAALASSVLNGLHRLAAVWLTVKPARHPLLSHPAASSPERRAIEAAAVRELAFSYLKQDPGFAGDLLAAADRHERADAV